MVNPQAENGHVDVANESVEALARIRIPGELMQVLWVIFRQTYGWHKKEDEIPLNQFVEMTGLVKPVICRSLAKLLMMGIIYKKNTGKRCLLGFQKDYEKWGISKIANKPPLAKLLTPISKIANEPLAKLLIPNTIKRNIKEKKETPIVPIAPLVPLKTSISKIANKPPLAKLLTDILPPLDKFSELKNQFQTAWNLLAREKGLAKVISIPKTRENKLRTRFQEEAFRQNVEKIFAEIKDSAFLLGANDRNWKIDFDWLIENDRNYLKVLEGKYKNKEAQYGRTGAKRNILDAGSGAAFDRIDAKAREEMEADLREEAGGVEGKPSGNGLF